MDVPHREEHVLKIAIECCDPCVGEEEAEKIFYHLIRTRRKYLMKAGLQQRIQAAIERLPLAYREALLLCDRGRDEVPGNRRAIGGRWGTVMSRISRARKLLRGMLAEDD